MNILIDLHLSLRLFKIVRFVLVVLEVFEQIPQVFRKKSLKEYTGFMLFCLFDNHSCPQIELIGAQSLGKKMGRLPWFRFVILITITL